MLRAGVGAVADRRHPPVGTEPRPGKRYHDNSDDDEVDESDKEYHGTGRCVLRRLPTPTPPSSLAPRRHEIPTNLAPQSPFADVHAPFPIPRDHAGTVGADSGGFEAESADFAVSPSPARPGRRSLYEWWRWNVARQTSMLYEYLMRDVTSDTVATPAPNPRRFVRLAARLTTPDRGTSLPALVLVVFPAPRFPLQVRHDPRSEPPTLQQTLQNLRRDDGGPHPLDAPPRGEGEVMRRRHPREIAQRPHDEHGNRVPRARERPLRHRLEREEEQRAAVPPEVRSGGGSCRGSAPTDPASVGPRENSAATNGAIAATHSATDTAAAFLARRGFPAPTH